MHRTKIRATVLLTLFTNEPLDDGSIASAVQRHCARQGTAWDAGADQVVGTVNSAVESHEVLEPECAHERAVDFDSWGTSEGRTFGAWCPACGAVYDPLEPGGKWVRPKVER